MENINTPELKQIMDMIKNVTPKHCDLCGNKYEEQDFNLVKTANQQATLHLKCRACGNSYLLNVFSPAAGMIGSSRSQLNLDLANAKEITKFASSGAISLNQALDAYNLFSKQPFVLESILKKNSEVTKKTIKA
jgi:hypothetical protein